jgi:hypothetical protein
MAGQVASRSEITPVKNAAAHASSRGAEMSKIPQGEWTAIAARYQNGESISKIARSYGCTPPAIHYILKRNRRLPAEAVGELVQERQADAAATPPMPNPPAAPSQPAGKFGPAAVAPPTLVRARPPIAVAPRQPADRPDRPDHSPPSPPTPGLDGDLHDRAEAAIEIFRTSFDAALTEGSPGVRERLRQAASDLMRVAARTTIVLDRLNANAERTARAQSYPRSAHARDESGRLGPGSLA